MPIPSIEPREAQALAANGAVLVDIRPAGDYAREHIAQARHIAMEQLAAQGFAPGQASAVIFHCRSGNRTRTNAQALAACAACKVYVLEGGIDAWKKAGLPVVKDKSRPIELSRQVQIAAGLLIVAGAVLGAAVSPWFHALSGLVGIGLIFAGLSGFCGLARVLGKMPWNRDSPA
ncbi:MAG: rhodanese family protein [Pollutimonas bauzanensis]